MTPTTPADLAELERETRLVESSRKAGLSHHPMRINLALSVLAAVRQMPALEVDQRKLDAVAHALGIEDSEDDPAEAIKALQAEVDRWREMHQAHLSAMRMIREWCEARIVGALPSEEALLCLWGPEPRHEAEAIITCLAALPAPVASVADLRAALLLVYGDFAAALANVPEIEARLSLIRDVLHPDAALHPPASARE